MEVTLTVSADQNTHVLVVEGLQITENAVLSTHRNGRLRKRVLELDG